MRRGLHTQSGNIGSMFPMIISVNEVKRIKEIVEEVKKELTDKFIIDSPAA